MASASESEKAGIFMNVQEIIPHRNCVIASEHPQPPTPLKPTILIHCLSLII